MSWNDRSNEDQAVRPSRAGEGDLSFRAPRPGQVVRVLLLSGLVSGFLACSGGGPSATDPGRETEVGGPGEGEAVASVAFPSTGPGVVEAWRDRGYPGVLLSESAADVAARTTGRIEGLNIRLGQVVERGDLLARVDTERASEELAEAAAALSEARSELVSSELRLVEATERETRLEQLEDLFAKEEIRQAELDRQVAAAAVDAAKARVERLEARRDMARLAISQSEVRAPFAGRVAARYVEAGSWVSPGAPIARLTGDGEAWVRFAVPADAGRELTPGARVRLVADEATTEPPGEAAATVRNVAPEVEPASRMIFAEARVDAGAEILRPGSVVRVFPMEEGD